MTLHTFGDPQTALGLVLRSALAERSDTEGVQVTGEDPGGAVKAPTVQVADDGGSGVWPIVEDATIRVSVYHPDGRSAAIALANLCRAVLANHSSDTIPRIDSPSRPLADRDPEHGDWFATFTTVAVVRSTTL